MKRSYPHLNGDTAFPNLDTVRPYAQYQNVFDYSRWKPDTKIRLLNVPWDSPDISRGNVVKFDTDAARDAWFDSQNGPTIELTSEFRVQFDQEIKLPVPFDVAQGYNYISVDFGIATSAEAPLPYETANGIRRYYFFLTDTRFLAGSTTGCRIALDPWMTYINHVTITDMTLERGHAPMGLTTVEQYLADPLNHSSWLLAPEPDAMESPYNLSATYEQVLNEDVWAVIMTTANIDGWGDEASATWTVPSTQTYLQGVPDVHAYALAKGDLVEFLSWCDVNRPQFIQTVQAVLFVGKELLAVGTVHVVGTYTLYEVVPVSNKLLSNVQLGKGSFGYPEAYADIPKLYTSPYCMLRLTTSNGETFDMAVENMSANVAVNITCSLIEPETLVSAHVNGYGSSDVKALTFSNISDSMRTYSGRWNDLSWRWNIPAYSLTQSARKYNEYADFYGRVQATNDYETANQNALLAAENAKLNADASANTAASNAKGQAATTKANAQNSYSTAYQNASNAANTGYQNTVNSANTAKLNADNSADTVTTNTALTVTANTALTDNAKNVATQGVTLSNNKLESDKNADVSVSTASLSSDMANAAIAASNNDAKANTTVALGGLNAIQALGDFQLGSAIFGSLQTYQNVTTDWACTNNSINVSLWGSKVLYEATFRAANTKTLNSTANNTLMTELQNGQLTYQNNTQNALATNSAANNVATIKGNAANSQSTAITNAGNSKSLTLQNAENDRSTSETNTQNSYDRTVANADATLTTALVVNERNYTLATGTAARNRTNAQEAIQNGIEQAAMAPPYIFGRTSDVALGVSAPMFVSWQVLRQADDAIATVGDAILRYGYTCGRRWKFTDFNLRTNFTYWEVSDVWMQSEPGVTEGARNELKNMLYNGVTVWSDPDKIGKVSIYD